MKIRHNLSIFPLLIMGVLLVFASSCEEDDDYNVLAPAVFNSDISYGDITDQDGNTYKTVTIDKQTWMAENLRTTKYNDGAAIPNVTDDTLWLKLTTPAYCWYDNDQTSYGNIYGALYNWYVVDATSNGGKNVCPTGWHVPSDEEWKQLELYLGMCPTDCPPDRSVNFIGWRGADSLVGGKLREAGTIHWISPNTGATNKSGFTALSAGVRYSDRRYTDSCNFVSIGYSCSWWTATKSKDKTNDKDYDLAYYRHLSYDLNSVYRSHAERDNGFSVRCLKD